MTIFVLLVIACIFRAAEASLVISSLATVSIAENVPVGTTVYQAATTGETGTVTYTLTGSTHFEIDGATPGLIITKDNLDYETTHIHELTITATDSDSTPQSATLVLTVTVIDKGPTFSRQTYSAAITDGSKAGTILGTYKATIPGDTSLVHKIASGNTNDDFDIVEADGVIKVATDTILDKTRSATYTLILHATDNGETATATVSVNVVDDSESGTSALSASLLSLMACALAYWIKG